MFNTLASYLLGTSNQPTTGGVEERNVRLTSVVSEDDWVLVDRDSEGNSVGSASSMESLDICVNLDNHNHRSRFLTRSSSTSSLPCTTMEESWFVTPPPCFTSAGPIHMETSPLENLLIEHPSMSVYQHTHAPHRNGSIPAQSIDSDFSADEEEEVEEVPVRRVMQQLEDAYNRERQRQRQLHTRSMVEGLRKHEEQCYKAKQAQKVQIQKACHSLKRKYLERANKAREVNYRNRHQRRSERSQGATRSYANNNRKC